jgi:hypothetical protein
MSMNLFESIDLDQPVPIVALRYRRPQLITRGKATPAERAQAEAIAPPKPLGYLYPTEGWVSGGWPA